jgi:glutathione S-transferase
MKLYFSSTSPFVRQCMVCAYELGLEERIEKLPSAVHPVTRDKTIVTSNPLGQVPTLITDTAEVLSDRRVICEYLNALGKGQLFPDGPNRWHALSEQSLAYGILDAMLLVRYELTSRPQALRWDDWHKGQMEKVQSVFEYLEKQTSACGERVDIGTISFGCALGYLDLRFTDYDWRSAFPATAAWFEQFNARPSMQATLPKA